MISSATVKYTTLNSTTGMLEKYVAYNVSSITDQPYPAGGFLRVLRNQLGQGFASPVVSELVSFDSALPITSLDSYNYGVKS